MTLVYQMAASTCYNAAMADLLTAFAQSQPSKVAVIDDRGDGRVEIVDFAGLEERANRLANALWGLGVRQNTKVVWCGKNSLGIVTMMNAARKIGATAVPLNYRFTDEEAAYVTDHCDTEVVFTDAEYAPLFARIAPHTPKVRTVLVFDGPVPAGMVDADALCAAASSAPPDVEGSIGAGDTMIYTSGTTGRPKGALRRGGTGAEQNRAMLDYIGYRNDDIYLTTGPLYHSGPGGFLSRSQMYGQTVVLQRKFDPEDWLRLLQQYRCTSTFSAPTPIRMICSLPPEVIAKYDRSSMRIMLGNAAPWSMALKHQYLEYFPADSLWEMYGSSELGVNCLLRPEDQLRKPGSCGREAPMVEVRLYDDLGNIVTGTGPQATGELFVRSPAVFADYYKQHDRYLEDQRDGFQTVGDVAYRDDEGYLYICDRKKDMIISGGVNIYPAEIEAALELQPEVYEAAVFGVPSEEWGESVHAVVVRRPGSSLTEEGLTAHARDHLAGYKVPRTFSWMDELPKTGSGKVLKRELRAPFWEGRDRRV